MLPVPYKMIMGNICRHVNRNKCLNCIFFQIIVYCATITGTTKTGDHILRKNSFIFWVLFPSKHVHYDNF